MKNKNFLTFLLAAGMVALLSAANAQSVFNVTSGAWNVAANWSPSGIPTSSTAVVIPAGTTCTGLGVAETCASLSVGGSLTLNGFAFTNNGPTIVSNAATLAISSSTGTKIFGSITIQSGGYFNAASGANGALFTCSGSITNNGAWNAEASGQSEIFTLAGTGCYLAGSGIYSNQSITVTGTYTVLPGTYVWLGLDSAGSGHLQGAGSLTNQGTIFNECTAFPTIATLNCSAVGNTLIWSNINGTITPTAMPYYNLVLGNTGSSGANLNGAGLSIANNFTLGGIGNVTSWPANNSIGGTLIYSTTSGTVSTFPTSFSIGGLSQTSGKLAIPAGGTLTVTGTGTGIWATVVGDLTQAATSIVQFTGGAPGFGGNFASLNIAATATNASVTSLVVTNSLTVATGASLNVSALSGGTYTMGANSFYGSGTIVGSITTTNGSKVFAATNSVTGANGIYGTNTITGNLTMVAGSTNWFAINSLASAANDQLVVGGTLSLSNSTFSLTAPSSGATIDTAAYTLVTAGSIITNTGNPVLKWVIPPANPNNYALVVVGTTIQLQDTNIPIISPIITATNATPNPVLANQPLTISVTVTPGTGTINPNTGVTVNLTAIGGSASQPLIYDGVGDYTNTVVVGNIAPGTLSLPVTVTDSLTKTATANISLTVTISSQTWNGGDFALSSNWSDGTNWVSGMAPAPDDNLIFAGVTGLSPVMNNSYLIASVTFSNNAGSFTISSSIGATLTLTGGVTNDSADPQNLSVPIALTAPVTLNAGTGGLTLGQTVTNGGNLLTITDGGSATTISGAVSGSGGLTMSGSGTTMLLGVNTYTGNTSVSNGTLLVDGSIGSSVVTVTNAILGGDGTIGGPATLQPSSVLAPGTNGMGTLTFSGNLTLNALSTNTFAVTTAGGASNEVMVLGALTLDDSVVQVTSGTALYPSTNVLFTYDSDVGAFNPTVVFDVAPVHPASLVDNGSGQISLVVPDQPPVAGPGFTLGAASGIPVTVQIVGGKYAPVDSYGDALTITSVTGATNGAVTTDGTNVTYTATNGTADSFTYTVSDPYGATASQTISVTISNSTGQGYNQISGQLIGGLEVLQFAGIPGYQYALDWTQNLTPPVTWTPLTTNTASLSNGSLFFTNTPSGGSDYYRTRYVP